VILAPSGIDSRFTGTMSGIPDTSKVRSTYMQGESSK
jgi:hypothetical protein